jgi:acyl-CoA reductase-like NAD-dependent aldehyde dehydrogenase
MPMGVVGLIVPWNWPLSILAAKLPHALLAGNTVVIKPAEHSSLATMQTIDLMARALPPVVINAVTSDRDTAGRELVANPAVRKISLTGSVRAGMEVMGALRRTSSELGGNDAGIVLPDARIIGHGLDPEVTMGPLNSRMQLDKVRAFVEDARRRGARSRRSATWRT